MNTVTEAEAAKKSCINWAFNPDKFTACIGSQCMAWRWSDDGFEDVLTRHEFEGYDAPSDYAPPRPDGDGWVEMKDETIFRTPRRGNPVFWKRPWGDRRPGFCGLAEPRVAGMV
jgi:hypothetical protein